MLFPALAIAVIGLKVLLRKAVVNWRLQSVAASVLCPALSGPLLFEVHCFQKKTEKTSKTDLDLATKRYRELLKESGK